MQPLPLYEVLHISKWIRFYIPVYSDVSSPLSVGPSISILLVCPSKLKLRPVSYKEALLSGPQSAWRRGAMCGWRRVIEITSNALLWGISAVIMRQATKRSEFTFAVMLQMKFCKINWTQGRLTWNEILTFLMVSYLHWTLFWARFTNILKVQIGSLRSTLSLFAGPFHLLAVSSLYILYVFYFPPLSIPYYRPWFTIPIVNRLHKLRNIRFVILSILHLHCLI